ncbi:MAG: GntR family transcriptional regulator [Deltaproteobacteria bacterium]|jgi:DNA-binding transcriptional regulator YhcF (GntR family)|nr:GntR family transcriptional regulator [Deltaproteobacteria bacterium]MBW2536644.1 GntR family transcriptional regulator [Deltaproteobacteria bacterium]
MSEHPLAIAVDFASDVPIYRQIADEIRALVAMGRLVDGDELPSVRQLGTMVGVNLNTVAKAYRALADEGLVELRHGAGARVRQPAHPYRGAREPQDEDRALQDVIGRMVLAGASRKKVEKQLLGAVERFYAKGGKRKR